MVSSYEIINLTDKIGTSVSMSRISEYIGAVEAASKLGLMDAEEAASEIDECLNVLEDSESAVYRKSYDFSNEDKVAEAVAFKHRFRVDKSSGEFFDSVANIIKSLEKEAENREEDNNSCKTDYVKKDGLDFVVTYRMEGIPAVAVYASGKLVGVQVCWDGLFGNEVDNKLLSGVPNSVPCVNGSIVHVYGVLSLKEKDIASESQPDRIKRYIKALSGKLAGVKFLFFAEDAYVSHGNIFGNYSLDRGINVGLKEKDRAEPNRYSVTLGWLAECRFAVCNKMAVSGINERNISYWAEYENLINSIDFSDTEGYRVRCIYEAVDAFDEYKLTVAGALFKEDIGYSECGDIRIPVGGFVGTDARVVGARLEADGGNVRAYIKLEAEDVRRRMPVTDVCVSLDELYKMEKGDKVTLIKKFGKWSLAHKWKEK